MSGVSAAEPKKSLFPGDAKGQASDKLIRMRTDNLDTNPLRSSNGGRGLQRAEFPAPGMSVTTMLGIPSAGSGLNSSAQC